MGPVIMSVEEQQSLISSRAENALKNSSGSPSINSVHRHISSIKSFADNSNVNEKLGKTSNGNVKLGTGIIVLFNLFLGVCLFWALREHPSSSSLIDSDRSRVHLALYNWDYSDDLTKNISSSNYESVPPSLPKVLIDRHFYKTTDFENEAGVFVPYWWKHDSSPTRTQESFSGLAKWGPCYVPKDEIEVLGYVHKPTSNGEAKSVNDYYRIPSACETHVQDSNLSGMCTPGFLIIGAGKCGTSSLYFYLIDHPRVAPARQKQIGYFKVRSFQVSPLMFHLGYFLNHCFFFSTFLMKGLNVIYHFFRECTSSCLKEHSSLVKHFLVIYPIRTWPLESKRPLEQTHMDLKLSFLSESRCREHIAAINTTIWNLP